MILVLIGAIVFPVNTPALGSLSYLILRVELLRVIRLSSNGKRHSSKGTLCARLQHRTCQISLVSIARRQYFGVLLLIFEWGTTFPFIMPDVPVQDIPFKDDIGKVIRVSHSNIRTSVVLILTIRADRYLAQYIQQLPESTRGRSRQQEVRTPL